MTELPCPNCGSELAFLEQYQRHYCHRCQRYAPEGYGSHGRQKCPSCGGVLSYVAQYDRFYCFRCNAYAAMVAAWEGSSPDAGSPVIGATQPAQEAKPTEPVVVPTAAAPEKKRELTLSPSIPEASPALVPEAPAEAEARPLPSGAPEEPIATPVSPTTAEAPAAKPAEPVAQPPSDAMVALATAKPAVVRLKVFSLRKAELVDLCRAYELDSSGTRDDLQERLLSYLDDLESGPRRESDAAAAIPIAPMEALVETASPAQVAVIPVASPVAEVEKPQEIPRPVSTPPVQTVLVEEPPARAAIAAPIPVTVTPPVVETPKIEHPCPTCGRELEYISQYGRWYCYACQRYAPLAKPKNACPTCGATLRWIEPYQRWWCESCRKYAPADLPKPIGAVARPAVRESAFASQADVASGVAAHHRHASPGAAIGLVAFGLVLFLAEAVLVEFPPAFGLTVGFTVPAGVALALRFLAFLFVAVGAIAGLMSVREHA